MFCKYNFAPISLSVSLDKERVLIIRESPPSLGVVHKGNCWYHLELSLLKKSGGGGEVCTILEKTKSELVY